ncbi:MAG: hypothetical protein ACYSUI_25800 [Planctomycetota bacterium]|jgi:uncharacterized Fe-S cluster-containing MiaB family protein
MNRYAQITKKLPREIVLLRSLPCIWSRCTFCDYIDDNTNDVALIERVAAEELAKVTGRFGRLEVINSGSIQELPESVRLQIRELLAEKGITEFICESYWAYRKQFDRTRAFFGVPTRIKVGVETFDHHLRNDVLGKGMDFDSAQDVRTWPIGRIPSACWWASKDKPATLSVATSRSSSSTSATAASTSSRRTPRAPAL